MGCPKCGGKVEYCGERAVLDIQSGSIAHTATEQMYQLLYYCRECNANIEYTKLLND